MTDSLVHRGPDDAGYAVHKTTQATIGMGHRRLSILDLTPTGHQPMYYRQSCIVYNGEIYNYQEIRRRLQATGHQFVGNSDTEVILHAYEEWGMDMLRHFIGMFAFCLYDEKKQKVLLVRDRAGVKPLYYYRQPGLLLFGSELKAIRRHPAFDPRIAPMAVKHFLQFGYISAPGTIYQDTFKLQPGHYAELDLHSGNFSLFKYWDALDCYTAAPAEKPFDQVAEELEDLLKDACNLRMVSDVPVGVFLSGGYDSSLVAALLQQNRTSKIKTFTIGFEEERYNEAQHAKKVAAHLGTDHHEYYCSIREAKAIIPELPYYFDEPFADASAIPTILVSRMARQQVKVALSADAGDELFAGYDKYRHVMALHKKLAAIPAPLRQSAAKVLEGINPARIPFCNQQYNFETRYYKGISLLRETSLLKQFESIARSFPEKQLNQLLPGNEHLQPSLLPYEEMALIPEPLHQLLFADYRTYMVDDILVKVDRATMSASLEGREPLLDHRILEYAAGIPPYMKLNKGGQKQILKFICHKYVPKTIMERPKMGFGIPILEWFGQEIADLVHELLNPAFIKQQDIFSWSAVETEIRQYQSARSSNIYRLWNLLMFQLWYKRWME